MRCCIQNCLNDSKTSAKSQGISFHSFPKEPVIRAAWLEALSLINWELTEHSVVCSKHFKSEDVYKTKNGRRKIRKGAVPIDVLDHDADLDSPAAHRVCIICLEIDTRSYNIREQNLDQIYEQVTGIYLDVEDPLPTRICWECAHRLQKAESFKQKALRAHSVLTEIIDTTCNLNIRDIKSIDRIKTNLRSNLVKKKLYENNDCNLLICVNEIIKSETDSDNEYNHNDNNHNDNNHNDNNDNECDDNACNGYDEENEIKAVASEKIEATTEDESGSEIYFYEFLDNFESDDDEELRNICKEVIVKETEDKVKKNNGMKKGRTVKKKKEDEPMKKNSEDDSFSSLLDNHKNNETKDQKNCGLDENLFTITTLTKEEQIAEVEKRKESTLYKNALFKCTICYRGFQNKEGYDVHLRRHSEQFGAHECLICKTRYKESRLLRTHMSAMHTVKFSCKKCPFVTRTRYVAKGHEKWHSGTKYQCPHCPSTFEKKTTYLGHIRIKHVSDFVCELCGYMFISEKGISFHKKVKHGIHDKHVELAGPYCELCKVKFASEEAHSRHLKLSARHCSDDDPNRIRNDSQISKNRVVKRRKRGPRGAVKPSGRWPAPCEQCGVELRDMLHYAQHFRHAHPDKKRTVHPAKKTPFMCEQCGRKYISMAHLRNHMWVHTGEKHFKCSHCPKSFTNKPNLVMHEKIHSATRPTYQCELCGKLFAFKYNRDTHMFIHTGLKPFKCETCGKSFMRADQKKSHVEHVHLKKSWPRRVRSRKAPASSLHSSSPPGLESDED